MNSIGIQGGWSGCEFGCREGQERSAGTRTWHPHMPMPIPVAHDGKIPCCGPLFSHGQMRGIVKSRSLGWTLYGSICPWFRFSQLPSSFHTNKLSQDQAHPAQRGDLCHLGGKPSKSVSQTQSSLGLPLSLVWKKSSPCTIVDEKIPLLRHCLHRCTLNPSLYPF